VLVDEFQDTNIAQYELLKLLVPPGKRTNLTVVGDDSQCLPPTAIIATPDGGKAIKEINRGDEVITAVGKGHTSVARVSRVFRRKRRARLLTFKTEDGKKITLTDNHKMFCFLPAYYPLTGWHFVYLMHQQGIGWRIGVTNSIPQRLRLETHADTILAIGSYKTDQEARFFEAYYAAKYGLPTVPFTARPRQAIQGKWLARLFSEIDTEENARVLAKDLNIELDSPQYSVDGITHGISRRAKVHLSMCHRNYRSKSHKKGFVGNPGISHQVHIETSNTRVLRILKKAGFNLTKAKKGKRFRFQTPDLETAWEVARELTRLTGGIMDKKFVVGRYNYQHLPTRIVPASHVLPGMYLPILKGKQIEYKMVVSRREEEKTMETYDLEVKKTHNFIADGIVVHNSIYKFRGAAVSNILRFRDEYRHAKTVVLTENYRSTQSILDPAYRLITHNNPDTLEAKLGIKKNLVSRRNPRGGQPVKFIHTDRVENEADAVAKYIMEQIKGEEYEYRDIAILVRANNHAQPFMRALSRHGIPYQFLGPGRLFRQPEIIDLISYLKVLYDFEDSIALYRLLSIEQFAIPAKDLIKVNNLARRKNLTLYEACENLEDVPISQTARKKIRQVLEIIEKQLARTRRETAGQLLYDFLQASGLLTKLLNPKSVEAEKRAANISKLFDKLKSFEAGHEDATVPAVVDWIDLASELGESPLATDTDWTKVNAVNLLTVHSAKGLEFPIVFLTNLVSQRFPTIERREQIPIPEALIKEELPSGNYHLQEERRLFYVGMTRARDRLVLSAADYYGEGKREKIISPFVFEALGDGALSAEQETDDNQLTFLDYSPPGHATVDHEPVKLHIDYLSYSQIETFKVCPLHYKLKYLLKLPSPPSGALSFGTSLHAALKEIYSAIMRREKVSSKYAIESLRKNWISEGYSGKKHENRMFEKGEKYLKNVFKEEARSKKKPVALEQQFVVPLTTDRGKHSFLKIGGKIDRVDEIDGGRIEIMDYKTGANSPTQRQADHDLQLTFYALAAVNIKEFPFGRKADDILLTFYYLDGQKRISTTRSMQMLEKAKEDIFSWREKIEASDFSCSKQPLCEHCEYAFLCRAE
jgi:DNA helicase-2/ATP-dependent DNA helicase PcrA